MERKELLLLNPAEYEHHFDKSALKTLEGTPGLEKAVKYVHKHGVERIIRLSYTGSNIKVTSDNFPELYKLLEEACANIFLKDLPELYIQWDYDINAFAIGSQNPIIILNSGAVDLLSDDELLYLLGHEAGHIKSGHMLYHDMALVIPFLGDLIGAVTLGIGSVVSAGLELALLYWYRMSELTADRAGLLACQDKNTAFSTLMKMGGVPKNFYEKMKTEDFIKQANDFQDFDFNTADKVAKTIMISLSEHPWTVLRTSELIKWINSGKYDEIIEMHGKGSLEEIEITCQKCGKKLGGNETFCGVCGSKVWKR
ncbi:MAG TPA: M48 family metalloprotease [Methanobacterium sp.]|nr:M48 family metalloprotease [Methanobacterium sp.]